MQMVKNSFTSEHISTLMRSRDRDHKGTSEDTEVLLRRATAMIEAKSKAVEEWKAKHAEACQRIQELSTSIQTIHNLREASSPSPSGKRSHVLISSTNHEETASKLSKSDEQRRVRPATRDSAQSVYHSSKPAPLRGLKPPASAPEGQPDSRTAAPLRGIAPAAMQRRDRR
eukprot:2859970-Rhodomonas_salina.1